MLSTQFDAAHADYGTPSATNYGGVRQSGYRGPHGGGASLQTGNRESTNFFFGKNMLRGNENPVPLAGSKATYSSEVGKYDSVGQMGSVSPVHPHQIDSTEQG